MKIDESYALFTGLRQRMASLLHVMESPYPMQDRVRHALDGSIKFSDCHTVQRLLEAQKPARCLEIGSFLGFSTRWLLECGRSWGMHVTAVDPNIRHRIFDNPRWMVEGMNAEFLDDRLDVISGFFGAHGDWTSDYERYLPHRSREWAARLAATRRELDGDWGQTFDCIYIDADHSYPAVMDGFRHAIRLLAPGGAMIFHDATSWPGVNRALTELREEYADKARVEILDGSAVFDHPGLAGEPVRHSDGIGYFRLRQTADTGTGSAAA